MWRRDNGKVVEFEEVKYGMLMMVLCDREGSLTQEDINKLKAINPKTDFVIEKIEKENASLPPIAEKIKDMFGAKIISHEQRDKGKGASGKSS